MFVKHHLAVNEWTCEFVEVVKKNNSSVVACEVVAFSEALHEAETFWVARTRRASRPTSCGWFLQASSRTATSTRRARCTWCCASGAQGPCWQEWCTSVYDVIEPVEYRARAGMMVKVKTLTAKEVEIDIEPIDTNERIEKKEGVPPVQLEDRRTLAEYNFQKESTLHQVCDEVEQSEFWARGGMTVKVKTREGKDLEIDFEPTDTIRRIKELIEEMLDIPPEDQRQGLLPLAPVVARAGTER